MIVKLKGFSLWSSFYRVRKRKSNISVHLDLTERRYLLLKDVINKVKDDKRVDFVLADIALAFKKWQMETI